MSLWKAMEQQDCWSSPRPARKYDGIAGIDLYSLKVIEHVT